MPHTMTWLDRMRIERLVWALDQRLYDLPRHSRIAKRREVRENLRAATVDVGATDALRNLGNSRQLAAEYRAAEYGDEARPAWIAAALFLATGQLVLTALLSEAASAFGDGIKAANPNATGTFTWSGIHYLQDTVTYTFADGKGSSVGGAWTPLAWALWIVATVLVGRLWRVASVWRRRRTRQSK
ncbi:MAG: hypothetical protein QOC73_32 [Actinomycetota bacterium]|jgi:hypothetical protein|nr:hypothetical protein [Actinomycetota bacterium]MDQ1496626.1 hypothetical protein [Actinomycetota bacterium]